MSVVASSSSSYKSLMSKISSTFSITCCVLYINNLGLPFTVYQFTDGRWKYVSMSIALMSLAVAAAITQDSESKNQVTL
jgi:hypothetical protein